MEVFLRHSVECIDYKVSRQSADTVDPCIIGFLKTANCSLRMHYLISGISFPIHFDSVVLINLLYFHPISRTCLPRSSTLSIHGSFAVPLQPKTYLFLPTTDCSYPTNRTDFTNSATIFQISGAQQFYFT